MNVEKAYVISAEWGEYDDYTYLPVFICHLQVEAQLFTEALNEREEPYWEKFLEAFSEFKSESRVSPRFYWRELEVLGLGGQRHNNS